jgi:hypothetical protein
MTMKIHDNGTDRDMTEQEQTAYLDWQKQKQKHAKAQEKAEAEKATARQAVLDRLGITADEAALLLG